jgi:hypothetical protein
VFPIWDHLFGTWQRPAAEDELQPGLPPGMYPWRTVFGGMWGCTVAFWRRVVGRALPRAAENAAG